MARSALYVVALVVAAIALQAPTQASFTYTEEDLASDDSMWALYERWAAHHEVVREHGEKARRFPIFKYNARRIHDKYGNKGKSAINIFGDMTFEEIPTGLRESDQDEQCSDNFASINGPVWFGSPHHPLLDCAVRGAVLEKREISAPPAPRCFRAVD